MYVFPFLLAFYQIEHVYIKWDACILRMSNILTPLNAFIVIIALCLISSTCSFLRNLASIVSARYLHVVLGSNPLSLDWPACIDSRD